MSKQAIVLIYDGQEANVYVQSKITEVLTKTGLASSETLQIYLLDEKEITEAILAKAVAPIQSHEVHVDNTPEENAVIFLGTVFKPQITESITRFSSELSSQYVLACIQHNNEELVNAVRIIGRGSFQNISREFLVKYNFPKPVFDIVQGIYNTCAGHIVP